MDYYDRIADGYDELHGAEQLEKYRALASLGLISSEQTILDLGHGSGLITQVFPNPITGLDTARELLARSPARPMIHDFNEDLPFDDASFDWVVCFTALHHARNPAQVVSEALRIARCGVAVSLLRALDSIPRLAELFDGWSHYPAGADVLFIWSSSETNIKKGTSE